MSKYSKASWSKSLPCQIIKLSPYYLITSLSKSSLINLNSPLKWIMGKASVRSENVFTPGNQTQNLPREKYKNSNNLAIDI